MNIITATLGAVRAAHDRAHCPAAQREQRLYEAGREAADLTQRTPVASLRRSARRVASDFLAIYPAGSGR
jgi:hypothetical protein